MERAWSDIFARCVSYTNITNTLATFLLRTDRWSICTQVLCMAQCYGQLRYNFDGRPILELLNQYVGVFFLWKKTTHYHRANNVMSDLAASFHGVLTWAIASALWPNRSTAENSIATLLPRTWLMRQQSSSILIIMADNKLWMPLPISMWWQLRQWSTH